MTVLRTLGHRSHLKSNGASYLPCQTIWCTCYRFKRSCKGENDAVNYQMCRMSSILYPVKRVKRMVRNISDHRIDTTTLIEFCH